eukprot:GILI01022884.1.p1 GENE.GILI01022884.1~~GILI01022884.1.p1  ORF type:complete len:409 (-),score=86.17 GILI01022884.1:61-1266(-)
MLRSSYRLMKIAPAGFFNQLSSSCNIDTYYGVPDSLLKDLCAYVTDNTKPSQHVITSNEGSAVAMAAGYHMATGKTACVYMQNSGYGNSLNPLLSLAHEKVYSIPMLLLIGWRGDPAGKSDEPQHRAQGDRQEALLQASEIPYVVLDANSNVEEILGTAKTHFSNAKKPFAILIKRDTFDGYKLANKQADIGTLSREEAIETILSSIGDKDIVISTTGMPSREVFESRARAKAGHHRDFLTVGSMGHASAIAAGIALQKPDRNVFVVDGDGATIMHLGNLPINGMLTENGKPLLPNLKHIVVNNGAHDSVGGQPTVGAAKLGWITNVASAVGYQAVRPQPISTKNDIEKAVSEMTSPSSSPSFLEVLVKKGNRKDIGRPTTTPIQNKEALMHFIRTGEAPQ